MGAVLPLGEVVRAATNRRVIMSEEVRQRVDDYVWLLRRVGAVEIYERLVVDFACEYREIPANGGNVECHGCLGVEVRLVALALELLGELHAT